MPVQIKTSSVPTTWTLRKQSKNKLGHILKIFWSWNSKTYYNLLTWVYMDNCKNSQQTTCKKKFMSYLDVMGHTINVLSTRT